MADQALYNISGTVYDDSGSPANGRTVLVYERSNGRLYKTLTTNGLGVFGAYCIDDREYFVVVQPKDGLDTSNAKIFDKVIPKINQSLVGLNEIGIPNTMGFGVGTCPRLPNGIMPLTGYDDPTHKNYGNYENTHDGSIMVWIPAFWYKFGIGTNGLPINEVSILKYSSYSNEEAAKVDGYVLHRAFINAGAIKPGFFIDKYPNSFNSTLKTLSSKKGALQCTTNTQTYQPMPLEIEGKAWVDMGITPAGQFGQPGEAFLAAKKRGSSFFPTTVFMWSAIGLLAYAQYRYADDKTCKWLDRKYPNCKTPRVSFSQSTTHDSFDTSANCMLYPDPYAYNFGNTWTGLYNVDGKTTHNGQECGVDYGMAYTRANFSWGTTSISGTYSTLKKSVDVSKVNFIYDASPVDNTVRFPALYESIGVSSSITSNTNFWRSEDKPYFSGTNDSTSANYKYESSLIPHDVMNLTLTKPMYPNLGVFCRGTEDFGWCRTNVQADRMHSGIFSIDIAYYGYSERSKAYSYRMGLYT